MGLAQVYKNDIILLAPLTEPTNPINACIVTDVNRDELYIRVIELLTGDVHTVNCKNRIFRVIGNVTNFKINFGSYDDDKCLNTGPVPRLPKIKIAKGDISAPKPIIAMEAERL